MSRRFKIGAWVVGGLLALVLLTALVGLYVAQSDWFREQVRKRIVSELESATGGRAEIGKFQLDWKTLVAEMDDVVLHGTEPATGPPLLRIKSLVIGLKIVSLDQAGFRYSFPSRGRAQDLSADLCRWFDQRAEPEGSAYIIRQKSHRDDPRSESRRVCFKSRAGRDPCGGPGFENYGL